MSRHGTWTQTWGDGDYSFRLGYMQLCSLEQFCDLGCELIAARIRSKDCRHRDVNEVIRLGLIGAGMSQGEAGDKVKRFVQHYESDEVSFFENRELAWAIIYNSLMPPKDDGLKKKKQKRATKGQSSQEEKPRSPDLSASPQ